VNVGLERFVAGDAYLRALRESLPEAVERFKPDLAIWLSGADPHQNDRFGQMQFTLRNMSERDQFVMSLFVPRGIPLAVLYGGGYNRELSNTARLHRNTVAAAIAAR
jgi:acetoin utilization deacetylase AcuC-like enzyme